ncbi:FtsQ-type POTRA domain-containing protein [Sinomonas albida]|uniref:FtsQ-type POTRA domain-containing protein n=1 Tax=Sinomonas albida TaxID=369942 RepID=UPI0010A930B4|nr:FtsQ-type POTRA domain-containing protein [Sinomonas albida]
MPSPRKPRVPRTGSGQSSPRSSFQDDEALDASRLASEPTGEERSRVSLGSSSKVTVLRPVRDGDHGDHGEDYADFADEWHEAPEDSHDEDTADASEDEEPRPPKPARTRGWGARRARKAAAAKAAEEAAASRDVLAFPVPRARRVRRRVIVIAASAVALVAGIMALLVFSPVLAVRTITVEGTKMLAPAQVVAALKPIQGRPLPLVGPDDVSRLVTPIVQVKSVRTRAVPPNTLLVTVVERVPVALVKQSDGFSVVDGDGVEIAKTKDQSAFAVPVIDASGAPIAHPTFLAITSVLGALPADVLSQLATAKADSVDSVQLKLADGKTVIWGNSQDRDLKAKVLAALMKTNATPVKGQPPVTVYDVSTPRHPVTR